MPADDQPPERAAPGPGNQTNITGDVYGPVFSGTFHDKVEVVIAPSLSPTDRNARQRMLKQVRNFWVEGVLDQSLYQELLIALNLETDPQAVSFTGPRLATRRDQEAQPLPAGTTIAQVYQAASQRLLILGAPGAGKTTLLLDLTRSLLLAAEQDETRPIPVVFNLSSWAQQRPPLERWLVQELRDQYGVGRRYAQEWLKQNAILPLLDGLDEVAEPQRAACVAAINTFIQEHGSEGIVVCSRVADYQAIGSLLALDAAVQVQPLDDTQIYHYVAWGGGEPLAGVGAVLAQDADLRELARAPLILNILALAYQGQRPEELVGLAEAEQRRRLFDAYVQRMFERSARNDPKRYTREQMLRWLRWLARSLANDNQTVFQVELMQPWWLKRWWEHGLYVIGSTLGASVTGSIVGALLGVFLGLMYGLGIEGMIAAFPAEVATTNVSAVVAPGRGPIVGLSVGADFGLVSGLVGGLVAGSYQRNVKKRRTWQSINGILIVACVLFLSIVQLNRNYTITTPTLWLGLIGGLATRVLIRDEGIRPTEALRWSWRTLLRHWYFVLLFGLVGWLIFGLVGGTLFGLVGGIVQAEVQTKRTPNQGIWRSLWHSLAVCTVIGLGGALGGWLVTWLIIGLTSKLEVSLISGLLGGLLSGLVFGLVFGGLAFVQHFALRAICALCGYAPWNYPRFLDYAVERILLHRVGGSYIFVHRMLLEYFAEQDGARPS